MMIIMIILINLNIKPATPKHIPAIQKYRFSWPWIDTPPLWSVLNRESWGVFLSMYTSLNFQNVEKIKTNLDKVWKMKQNVDKMWKILGTYPGNIYGIYKECIRNIHRYL